MQKSPKQMRLELDYAESGNWFVPVRKIKIDDRTFALRFGQPVQLGTSYEVAKATGLGRKILKRLAAAGFIDEVKPTPKLSMYYYAQILAFMEQTRQDPKFWDQVRTDAYLHGNKIEEARVL